MDAVSCRVQCVEGEVGLGWVGLGDGWACTENGDGDTGGVDGTKAHGAAHAVIVAMARMAATIDNMPALASWTCVCRATPDQPRSWPSPNQYTVLAGVCQSV